MRTFLFAVLSTLTLANSAHAEGLSDYDRLMTFPAKYEVFGTICEYLAKIRLEEQYPTDQYDVEVGIEYRQNGRVIGEIDVVIFRKTDMEAILVGQVKCRGDMSSARRHAHEQNQRFLNTMMEPNVRRGPVTFRSTSDTSLVIVASQMDEVEAAITASQDGGEEYGFDLTVGHDLDDVTEMRDRLLACQASGACPMPH